MKLTVRISAPPTFKDGTAGVSEFVDRIRRADEYGFDRISVGDTQLNNLECFTAIGLAAQHSSRAMLGPGVTNPVTRDVGVMANTLASLNAVSGGRMFCLMARGDGAVHNAGLNPAKVDQIAEYYLALKDLLNTGHAVFGKRTVRLPWAGKYEQKVPVYLVAEGPRMLHLAGQIADGVFIGAGLTQVVVDDALGKVTAGAQSAGRTLADLDVWWDTRSGIAPTRADAMYRARESLASVGNHVFRAGFEGKHAPEELHGKLRDYARRFDYSEKGTSVQNGPLMDELGLTDYFEERFGVIGTPDDVVERLRSLEKIGVHQVSMASHDRGLREIPDSLTLLGADVLPHVR
jgi:5,10-methylenetetrahydromethanopterin reductase